MKVHFRRKSIQILIPVKGGQHEMKTETYQKYKRDSEGFKELQRLIQKIKNEFE